MSELPARVLDLFTHVGLVEGFTVVATMMVEADLSGIVWNVCAFFGVKFMPLGSITTKCCTSARGLGEKLACPLYGK